MPSREREGDPEDDRTPVMLRHVEALSIEDASRVLQLNQQNFKSRVHRGRRLLRRHLVDFRDGLEMRPPTAPS